LIKSSKRTNFHHIFIPAFQETNEEVIVITFFGLIGDAIIWVWQLFYFWLGIFAAPFQQWEMVFILIPIWINWFFTEFFMEKYGTSYGNAISNGVMPILASLDWIRTLIRFLDDGIIKPSFGVYAKFALCAAVFMYGVFVIIAGIKIKRIVFFIGRVRWVTYVLLMFTPVIYNVLRLDWYMLLAIIVFFPLYYWIIEIFDRITPEPRVYREG